MISSKNKPKEIAHTYPTDVFGKYSVCLLRTSSRLNENMFCQIVKLNDHRRLIWGDFMSNRRNDPHFLFEKIFSYSGSKYIMRKIEEREIHWNNGPDNLHIGVIMGRSPENQVCRVYDDRPYTSQTTSPPSAIISKTGKSDEAGSTGYISWEKIITITSVPTTLSFSQTKNCTCCGRSLGNQAIPLVDRQR